MRTDTYNDRRTRWLPLAMTVALHLALVAGWRLARQAAPSEPAPPRHAMVWLHFDTPPDTPPPAAAPVRRERSAPISVALPPSSAPVSLAAPSPPARPPVTPDPLQLDQPPAATAPSARSADDILQQARRDVGKIDRELRKESLGRQIQAPPDTKLTRLQRGFADAAAAVPPKWYEAPKVEEIVDEGGYGRKRYRVSTAAGTYCVTYEGVNAPDGIDAMKNGIKPKITTCPAHEQPPTTQSWGPGAN